MRRILLVLVLAFALGFATPATAQLTPGADYTGGDIVDAPPGDRFNGRIGDNLVSLAVARDQESVQAVAKVVHRCRDGIFEAAAAGRGEIGGALTFFFTMRQREGALTHRLTIRGTFTGRNASGTISSRTTDRRGRNVCTGRATWVASQAPVLEVVAAPPPAAAVLRGQVVLPDVLPYEIVMRTSPDARRIVRLNAGLPLRCSSGSTQTAQYQRGAAIGADGTFRYDVPFVARSRGVTERGRFRLRGRFVNGGVTGTVEMSSTFRRGGRIVDRCRSGRREFAATTA